MIAINSNSLFFRRNNLCQYFHIISSGKCTKTKKDLVFILDGTNSVHPDNFQREKQFVKDIAHNLNIGPNGTLVSVVAYSNSPYSAFYLNQHTSSSLLSLDLGIDQIPYRGGQSYIEKALSISSSNIFKRAHGDRRDAPNVLILLNDGENKNPNGLQVESARLHSAGVTVLSIGVGSNVDASQLKTMASAPNLVLHATDFTTLSQLTSSVLNIICDGKYLLCK